MDTKQDTVLSNVCTPSTFTPLPLTTYLTNPAVCKRFLSYVLICTHGESCKDCCWPWQASCNSGGYGQFFLGRVGGSNTKQNNIPAHVFMFQLYFGPLDNHGQYKDNIGVLHTCDNRPCCNYYHLFLGTQLDNAQDKVQKGRQARGEGNGQSKLKESDIPEIFALYAQGYTMAEIAEQFGTSRLPIRFVLHKRTWTHVSSTLPDAIIRPRFGQWDM